MKYTSIVATLFAVALIGASTAPSFAAANTGGSSVDKEWCKKLERYYASYIWDATAARTRLQEINILEEAMFWLNQARKAGCPWAKNVQVPL